MNVIPVDCRYVNPEFASAYLLIHEFEGIKKGLFVECNTNQAITHLVKAAADQGIDPKDIDGLVITHVHLDHAGGAGLFLETFKNAKLYAHPRAARHAIDPSKLIAGATAVYGEGLMQKLYGTILPCDADRVVMLEDGAKLNWQGVDLSVKHTRGHANHHLCLIEPITKTIFTGDSFGCLYPAIFKKRGLVMIASTSPTDFDGQAALDTIDWIESQIREGAVNRVALTHFGFLDRDQALMAAPQLRNQIRFAVAMVERIRRENLNESQTLEHIQDWFIQTWMNQLINLDSNDLKLLQVDFKVNAQGLIWAAFK